MTEKKCNRKVKTCSHVTSKRKDSAHLTMISIQLQGSSFYLKMNRLYSF